MRAPGQHLEERVREDFEWRFFFTAGIVLGLTASTIAVWFLWVTRNPLLPWSMTAVALAGIIGMAVWWVRIRPQLHVWKKGLRGEREVAAVVADLGRLGYIARHDIQCEKDGRRWNIDHLLIGPSGVYVIETKWRSAAQRGALITFDGTGIRIGDGPIDMEPIEQVRGNVWDVRARLERAGVGDVPVRGVVCYPGAGRVEGSSGRDIWVLKPEALEKWIRVEEGKVARVGEARQKTVVAVVCGPRVR